MVYPLNLIPNLKLPTAGIDYARRSIDQWLEPSEREQSKLAGRLALLVLEYVSIDAIWKAGLTLLEQLSSERKDPMEILKAYNSTKLVISGNSSHLVPWHTKLGFQRGPCVSTLHSLTADGGVVAAMDLIILKVTLWWTNSIENFNLLFKMYPIAFFEFFEDEDGQKRREGPRSEIEEAQVNEKWMVCFLLGEMEFCVNNSYRGDAKSRLPSYEANWGKRLLVTRAILIAWKGRQVFASSRRMVVRGLLRLLLFTNAS